MTKRRNPDDCLPLTPAMFEVLIALADGEKHGYAMIKEVAGAPTARRAEPGHALRHHPPLRAATASSPSRPSGPTRRWTTSGGGTTG